jgi:hypothetical protein
MSLWVCKNCEHVGQGGTRPGSSLPACRACGHSTIVPLGTPKGQELAQKAGIDVNAMLAEEDRRIGAIAAWDWQKSMITRGIGVLCSGGLLATCLATDSSGGAMFWGLVTALVIGAGLMKYFARPS